MGSHRAGSTPATASARYRRPPVRPPVPGDHSSSCRPSAATRGAGQPQRRGVPDLFPGLRPYRRPLRSPPARVARFRSASSSGVMARSCPTTHRRRPAEDAVPADRQSRGARPAAVGSGPARRGPRRPDGGDRRGTRDWLGRSGGGVVPHPDPTRTPAMMCCRPVSTDPPSTGGRPLDTGHLTDDCAPPPTPPGPLTPCPSTSNARPADPENPTGHRGDRGD
jgi:hypothetical protein